MSALIRNKAAAFGVLLRLWAWYAGEQSQVTMESGLAINDSLINKPLGASEIAQLVNLHSEGLLSKKTVLDELQRGGVLDPDLVVEEEMQRVEEDRQETLDQQAEEAEAKLSQDIERASQFQATAPQQPQGIEGQPKDQEGANGSRNPSESAKAKEAARNAQ